MEEMLIDPLSSYSDDETKYGFTYDEEDFSEFQVDCDFPSEEEVKREREQMFQEIIGNFYRDYPHLEQATKIEEGVSYFGNVSETIIFAPLAPVLSYTEDGLRSSYVPDKSIATVFAIDSSDGSLYQLTTRTFDYEYVDYAIQGNIVYFINSRWERDHYINTKRNLPTPPFEIETYNLITTKWNSQEDRVPVLEVKEFKCRLWPDGLPTYSSSIPELQTPWANYFSACVVDDILFRCQAEDGKLFLSLRSLDHIAEDDAKFVSYHRIDLNHCLTGYCDLHFPKCFLNHLTGFKFCLVLFFSDFTFRDFTASVCILTVELAKVDESVRIRDDPDQSKVRKGPMGIFKISDILNKRSFNLPEDMPKPGLLKTCVKQENGESSKYQLFEFFLAE